MSSYELRVWETMKCPGADLPGLGADLPDLGADLPGLVKSYVPRPP